MGKKYFLNLLILFAVLSPAIVVSSEEINEPSSEPHIRQKRMPFGRRQPINPLGEWNPREVKFFINKEYIGSGVIVEHRLSVYTTPEMVRTHGTRMTAYYKDPISGKIHHSDVRSYVIHAATGKVQLFLYKQI